MEKIRNLIQESIDTKTKLLGNTELLDRIGSAAKMITSAFNKGKRVYFCGNGGSAADAQHLAAEFSGRFYTDRKALPAEALHCNTSYLTAVGNDYGFDLVYSRIVSGIGEEGDVLVAISTSGNSSNILNALKAAKENRMSAIGLTGESGGKMKDLTDILLNVPSNDTPRIQESHILIGHIICQLVEEEIFPSKK